MGSQQNDEPKQCTNNCGFFRTPATLNLRSKCYRDFRIIQEQAEAQALKATSSLSSTVVGGGDQVQGKGANRCWSCYKKVGLTGVRRKWGGTFCGTHRYPEMHECTFDFKLADSDVIAQGNPLVKADKLDRF